jgi:hypothetical protein
VTTYYKAVWAGVGIFALLGAYTLFFGSDCTTIGSKSPVEGSQGYRVYTNNVFKSFEHRGQSICVPEGWVAVGASETGDGTARFVTGKTGILISQAEFGAKVVRPDGSRYEVTMLYPLTIPRDELPAYTALVEHMFEESARIFNDVPRDTRVPHTVLVTVGLAGNSLDDGTRVYPDPTDNVTVFMRSPDQRRATELMLHAAVHLYNRSPEARTYLSAQAPFTEEEFEELEATWAEVALSNVPDTAFERLMYLYKVHSAVVTQNQSLATEPPFNDQEAFANMVPTVFVRNSKNYLDYQYGHYTLLPLVTAAVDALLYERQTGLTVEKILIDIHAGKRTNFMDTIEEYLPKKDYENIERWLRGSAQIPLPLIETAIARYDR